MNNSTRTYVLILLTATYTVNIIDRQVLAILVEPIKQELDLSDTHFGFLTGFAFAIFYATAGLPIAMLADRYNRVKLLSIALMIWSAMTALSGFAQNFIHLALARIGVGIGEAGGSPPAHSIISDLYTPDKRATALAIFGLGIPLGTLVGLWAGGAISDSLGWRLAFILAGLPGIFLSILIWFTIKEPKRIAHSEIDRAISDRPSLLESARLMARTPVILHVCIGGALLTAVGAAIVAWTPAFLHRTYDASFSSIGLALGLSAGIPGALGMYLGGYLSDRLGAKAPRWRLWVVALALLVSTPFTVLSFHAPSFMLSMTLLIPTFTFGIFFYQAASFAQIQNHVPNQMRAVAAAAALFTFNLLGQGLGPQIVGILSDLFRPTLGEASIRYSLSIVSLLAIWGAAHYWRAGTLLQRANGRLDQRAAP